LAYTWRICEHAFARYGWSDPDYIEDIDRRISALVLLWHPTISEAYLTPQIDTFVTGTRSILHAKCTNGGWRLPTADDLRRMSETGAWPGEPQRKVRSRQRRNTALVKLAAQIVHR
jgi:hypothetical protein